MISRMKSVLGVVIALLYGSNCCSEHIGDRDRALGLFDEPDKFKLFSMLDRDPKLAESIVPPMYSSEYIELLKHDEATTVQLVAARAIGKSIIDSALSVRSGCLSLPDDQCRSVVSVDPVYQFSPEQIRVQINRTYPTIMHQLRDNLDDYVWTNISSPEELGQLRMKTMNKFLSDYSEGKNESRYVFGELPILPFGDQTFDLALCSHFLFLYSDYLSAEFHYQAIQQMLRTAREVRVFPLLTLGRQPSPYLDEVSERFRQFGRTCTIKTVDYEFQRGGNQMLRVTIQHKPGLWGEQSVKTKRSV